MRVLSRIKNLEQELKVSDMKKNASGNSLFFRAFSLIKLREAIGNVCEEDKNIIEPIKAKLVNDSLSIHIGHTETLGSKDSLNKKLAGVSESGDMKKFRENLINLIKAASINY